MLFGCDDALHGIEVVADLAAQGGNWPGDIFEGEELGRVNGASPDELIIDMGEETFANFDAGPGEDEGLEGDVGQMHIFFERGSGFNLDQVPRIASDGSEKVGAGVAAVECKGGFVEGTAGADRLLSFDDDFRWVDDA